ncbi:MAG TPA: ABC transporter substrate-binding protein [Myxococcales bacterium]|nr:ABC transporter substrate-binding protein [Myxococcales bacterium]HIM02024.1 ABC transporter substrate-binding protein [Myxococcales bacterium]
MTMIFITSMMKKPTLEKETVTGVSRRLLHYGLGLAMAIFATTSATAAATDAAGAGARAMVESMVGKILVELAKEGIADEVKIKSLEAIVFTEFDFKSISRLVLARNVKKFSDEQLSEFTELFKVYLSRSYGSRLIRYANEDVVFKNARVEKRGDVTVMTAIVGGSADGIEMNYRVRGRDGTWRVIDVTIEGISLVSNFRSQFKDIVNRDQPEGLLSRLRDKTFVAPDSEPEKK